MLKHKSKGRIFDYLTLTTVYAALGLTPIFFLPFTLNVLDLNKQFLLFFLVATGFFFWLVGTMTQRIFVIRKTALDVPLILLWAVLLCSLFLSRDWQEGFFGNAATFTYTFLLHTVFMVFYFVCSQSLHTFRRIVGALIALSVGAVLSTAFFFMFGTQDGLTLGGSTLRFNATSTFNSLFVLSLLPAFFISLAQLLDKNKKLKQLMWWGAVFVCTGWIVMTSGFRSAMIAAAVGLAVLLVVAVVQARRVRYVWASITFGLLAITVLLYVAGVPAALRPDYPAEISLGKAASNDIVLQSMSKGAKPFLVGVGQGRFSQLFSLYRTSRFNSIDRFWSVRFEKPISEFYTIVAESGMLGVLSFAFVVVVAFFLVVRRRKTNIFDHVQQHDHFVSAGVATALLALTVTMFVTTFDTVMWLLWWTLLVLVALFFQPKKSKFTTVIERPLSDAPHYSLSLSFVTILVLVSGVAFGVYMSKLYRAEVAYARAVRAGDATFEERMTLLVSKSIALRPEFHRYHITAAQMALGEAQRLSSLPEPATAEITQLFQLAVNEAQIATQVSPNLVSTWQLLAQMYLYAQPFEPQANQLALDALQQAIALEPTNPFFFNQIGNAYAFQGNPVKAAEHFERAIELKPDFVPSYTNLAALQVLTGNLPEGIRTLERGLQAAANDVNYLLSLADLYLRRGGENDMANAQAIAEAVVRAQENNTGALLLLGRLAEAQDRSQEALRLYSRVLSIDENNETARARVSALRSSPQSAP